jgi:hypothetical protein
MARQIVDLDTPQPNGQSGDAPRTAFTKINDNFAELYDRPLPQNLNLLLNPEGTVNQRSFGGGALAAGVYGYDGWKGGSGGCNVSIASGVLTLNSGNLVQVLDGFNVAGKTLTLSVTSPSAQIGVSVGGVSGVIPAGAGRQAVTLTLPGNATGNQTLQLSGTGASLAELKLEVGSAASAFARRPPQQELALCQRWAELISGIEIRAAAFNAVDIMFGVDFKVTKRANPALSVLGQGTWLGSGTTGNTSTIVLSGPSPWGFRGDVTAFTGSVTPGYAYDIRGASFFADASP